MLMMPRNRPSGSSFYKKKEFISPSVAGIFHNTFPAFLSYFASPLPEIRQKFDGIKDEQIIVHRF